MEGKELSFLSLYSNFHFAVVAIVASLPSLQEHFLLSLLHASFTP